MNATQLQAWIQAVQILIPAGIQVAGTLRGFLTAANPALSPAEIDAAYVAIVSDDAVRAAFAEAASHPPGTV